MPRDHEFEPMDHDDYVCKHCGQYACDISLREMAGHDTSCVLWTDIPRIRRKPHQRSLREKGQAILRRLSRYSEMRG